MTTYYITIRAWRGHERQLLHAKIYALNDHGAATYAVWWLDQAFPISDGWTRRAYSFNGADWVEV